MRPAPATGAGKGGQYLAIAQNRPSDEQSDGHSQAGNGDQQSPCRKDSMAQPQDQQRPRHAKRSAPAPGTPGGANRAGAAPAKLIVHKLAQRVRRKVGLDHDLGQLHLWRGETYPFSKGGRIIPQNRPAGRAQQNRELAND
jgi:hypothetical protein